MASLIPGYEYDILISFRQKDKKRHRCICEFMGAINLNLNQFIEANI